MNKSSAKILGQFFTPQAVASTLVSWAVRTEHDRLLDPSCGDGRFIRQHRMSVGVDVSDAHCVQAREAAPWAEIHTGDFFSWAGRTPNYFDCVVGNPPFIRYQNFNGEMRKMALEMCAREGAAFSALTSSWAPFIVIAGSLLKRGGRMAFIVPAEIGHANYAAPLLKSLVSNFERVVIVAVKEKIFPQLSEDVWLLYAEGRGGQTDHIELALWEQFQPLRHPPAQTKRIALKTLAKHDNRLRRFLLPDHLLDYYAVLAESAGVVRFGDLARISVGYVTGANEFFHLRPSEARRRGIPQSVLKVTVRKGEQLPRQQVSGQTVKSWLAADKAVLLLDLAGVEALPEPVKTYLRTEAAQQARQSYKCRNRDPWYVVPDVSPPHAFLSYMSGKGPHLVSNSVRCVCANSVHAVRLSQPVSMNSLLTAWGHAVCRFSQELEGHPLGGGLLKLEPREAGRILLPLKLDIDQVVDTELLEQGTHLLRAWRHCA